MGCDSWFRYELSLIDYLQYCTYLALRRRAELPCCFGLLPGYTDIYHIVRRLVGVRFSSSYSEILESFYCTYFL
jgi:hypothetical protein